MFDIRDYASEGRWWAGVTGFVATSKDSHYDSDENVVISEGADIPIRFDVCGICDGRGNYVNPAIDSNGITGNEMDELGYEFKNDYLSGVYDIECGLCRGNKVVPVPTDTAHVRALNESGDRDYQYQMEREAERRMGA